MRRLGRFGLLLASTVVASGYFATTTLRAQDEAGASSDSPLVVKPQTPAERVNAALLLLKLARPDLAKEQIEQVVALNLTADELLGIRDTYGTGVFLRLARNADLQPAGTELLEQISAAARTQAGAEGYLDELIVGIDGNREDSAASLREIKRLGPDAVLDLVGRAGDDVQSNYRLERILSLLGDRAVGPLSDVLFTSSRTEERDLAIRVLARTASVDQIPTLVAIAGNENEPAEFREIAKRGAEALTASGYLFDASQSMTRFAQEVLSGRTRLPRDGEDRVLVYEIPTDAPTEAASLARLAVPESDIRKLIASRYLSAAVSIDGDDRDALRLLYVLRLDIGDADAAFLELSQRGPTAAAEVLDLALTYGLSRPAAAALDVVGRGGRIDSFAQNSAAARALNAPSADVQFAAARAAVQVAPEQAFPNSSRVVEILSRFLAGETSPKVVVVDPNRRRGGDVGGRLQQLGFEPILTQTGREGFREAASRSDVVLAVVHANSTNWELTPTVANFDADARTASIPVAVAASTQARDALRWVRAQHPDLLFLPIQADATAARDALAPALAQIEQSSAANIPERRREAANLLRQIVERRMQSVFPITDIRPLVNAAYDADDAIAVDAAVTLGYLADAAAQEELVSVVTAAMSEEVQQAGASSLVRSLSRFGSTLSADSVAELRTVLPGATDELRKTLALIVGLSR